MLKKTNRPRFSFPFGSLPHLSQISSLANTHLNATACEPPRRSVLTKGAGKNFARANWDTHTAPLKWDLPTPKNLNSTFPSFSIPN